MSATVTKMQLNEDGETVVFETLLFPGTLRKHVVKIRDIEPHPRPQDIMNQTLSANGLYLDYYPVIFNQATFLLHKDGFTSNCEKDVYKAVLNGYTIDIQKKTELTEDLERNKVAYKHEKEKNMIVLDI